MKNIRVIISFPTINVPKPDYNLATSVTSTSVRLMNVSTMSNWTCIKVNITIVSVKIVQVRVSKSFMNFYPTGMTQLQHEIPSLTHEHFWIWLLVLIHENCRIQYAAAVYECRYTVMSTRFQTFLSTQNIVTIRFRFTANYHNTRFAGSTFLAFSRESTNFINCQTFSKYCGYYFQF